MEATPSAFGRALGETPRAIRFFSQETEASLKVMLYDGFLSIRARQGKEARPDRRQRTAFRTRGVRPQAGHLLKI